MSIRITNEFNSQDESEVFLELLAKERPEIILMGGKLMQILCPNARYTKDIDINVDVDWDDFYNSVLVVLDNMGYREEDIVRWIKPSEYRCGDLRVQLRDKLSIDIDKSRNISNLSEVIVGNTTIKSYSVEHIASDKLSSILSEKRLRRIKDFYDLYILLNSYEINLEKFHEIFSENQTSIKSSLFTVEGLESAELVWDKLKLFDYRNIVIDKPNFKEVLKIISKFITKYLSCLE